MARQEGTPKTGGRKKGTPNLKTLVLRESLNLAGFDVIQKLNDLYPQLDPEFQAKVLLSFLPYLFPRPNSVDLTQLRTAEMNNRASFYDPLGNADGVTSTVFHTEGSD